MAKSFDVGWGRESWGVADAEKARRALARDLSVWDEKVNSFGGDFEIDSAFKLIVLNEVNGVCVTD